MELYFGSLCVPKVISYKADRETRKTKVEYNANGDMLIDMVNRKFKLTVMLGQLTEEEMSSVLAATEPVFFPVTFYTPVFGEIQRQFHVEEQPCEVQYSTEDGAAYKAVKLVLEER